MNLSIAVTTARRPTSSLVLVTWLIVCIALFGVVELAGAISTSVAGLVTDEHDMALPNALVDAITGGTVAAESTTHADGRFQLDVAPGMYLLRAVVKGMTIADARVEVNSSRTAEVVLKAGTFINGSQPAAVKAGPDEAAHEGQIVRIFYATDREPSVDRSPIGVEYTGARSADNELSYGACLVSIPRDHKMGALESPTLWSFDFRTAAGKYVTLTHVTSLDDADFYNEVSSKVHSSDSRRVLVFVHGFATTFADGARRTAQLAYDLGFDGAPILYSWPSQGSMNVGAYLADEGSIQWTTVHLRDFLANVVQNTGATAIELVAHSMGNRALEMR
jgi:hypothetical protein